MFIEGLDIELSTYPYDKYDGMIDTIYITSRKADSCIVCNGNLYDDELFVPVSYDSCVKVKGLHCHECNIFYATQSTKHLFNKSKQFAHFKIETIKLLNKKYGKIFLCQGEVVEHKEFGRGQILAVKKDSVLVDFNDGEKGLVEISLPSAYNGIVMRMTSDCFFKKHNLEKFQGHIIETEIKRKKEKWEDFDEYMSVSEVSKLTGYSRECIRKRCEKEFYDKGDKKAVKQGAKGTWNIPKNNIPEKERSSKKR